MCGIVGYIGNSNAVDTIVKGLTRLEYRGYDSAGVAVPDGDDIVIIRAEGKLENLRKALEGKKINSNMGIGHTRWATHGRPSEANAHPHRSGHIALVHNGIVENYLALKQELVEKGYKFTSDTDTEVLAHLIEVFYKGSLPEAVRKATEKVRGSYALAVISSKEPDKIVVTRKDSPLVIGVSPSTGEYLAISDIPAALFITRDFLTLNEGEMAVLTGNGARLYDSSGAEVYRRTKHIDWDPAMAEKAGYDDFMLKEIHEQPHTIIDTLRGKVVPDAGKVVLGELSALEGSVSKIERILVLACGTSWHSGLLGKIFIEKYAHIPVEVEIASEYPNRDLPLNENILCICVSQSGETADTKSAMRAAKSRGGKIVAMCNVVGSAIANEADYVLYTHAGPEISVASTKAFMSQAMTFLLLALWLGEKRKITDNNVISSALDEVLRLPEKIGQLLETAQEIKAVAEVYKNTKHFMYLGRHYNCPIAYEGSLKLKETTYIHAEAYASGELKHGPIAMLDENFPVMAFAPAGKVRDKIFSNLQEAKARGSKVIAIMSESSRGDHPECDHQLYVPECSEEQSPFLTVIVAQLFAYFTAKGLGKDVDKPRNLAKSVTVE